MADIGKTIGGANYFLRTVVYLGVVGVVIFGIWEAKAILNVDQLALEEKEAEVELLQADLEKEQAAFKDAEVKHTAEIKEKDTLISTHEATIEKQGKELTRTKMALKFLKMDHRIGTIDVVSQAAHPEDPKRIETVVRFQEWDDYGNALGKPVEGKILGEEMYLDALVIKFQDKFIEEADALRGRSICRFRRIYGEDQPPKDGISIDREAESPGDSSQFEKDLWNRFTQLSNDSSVANKFGVRSAQGGGPSIIPQPGKRYRIELRATGDLSIKSEAVEEDQKSP